LRSSIAEAEVITLRDQLIDAIPSRFAIRLEPEPMWLA
jgi:hypothetical protein